VIPQFFTIRGPGRTSPAARLLWLLGMVAATGSTVLAHHSYSVYYLEEDTIEVEGEVIEFQYVNPHAWIHFVGRDAFGRERRYAAEWGSRASLERQGIRKDVFQEGDRVRVWASPSRDPNDTRLRLKRVERRRGNWKWSPENRRDRDQDDERGR
jgi:hypothetical protein